MPVLHLRVANAVRPNAAISSPDDDNVVIAVVNYTANKRPLILACSREQFHTGGNTVELQQGMHDFLPLRSQVFERRTHEDLVFLLTVRHADFSSRCVA